MQKKYSPSEVRQICLSGTDTAHTFLIPITVSEWTITFKASYWYERGAYVAVAGITTGETWSPVHVVAPAHLIASLATMLLEMCGIGAISGVTELDRPNLLNTLFKVQNVPPSSH